MYLLRSYVFCCKGVYPQDSFTASVQCKFTERGHLVTTRVQVAEYDDESAE